MTLEQFLENLENAYSSMSSEYAVSGEMAAEMKREYEDMRAFVVQHFGAGKE